MVRLERDRAELLGRRIPSPPVGAAVVVFFFLSSEFLLINRTLDDSRRSWGDAS